MTSEKHASPERIFGLINSYQAGRALEAAIRLDLFSQVGENGLTSSEIAKKIRADERGTRILCDFLAVHEFLHKEDLRYSLTAESRVFLDQKSELFLGSVIEFLLAPQLVDSFEDLHKAVRKGGTLMGEEGTMEPEHPLWIKYARGMAPLSLTARFMTELVPLPEDRPVRVLDIAAGHGIFGITFAERYPQAQITALDWPPVLEIAAQHARNAGVEERFHRLPGSAFEVDYGSDYDLVLATNFFHHFDAPTCQVLLRRMNNALRPDGALITLEFVPDKDRLTPLPAACFPLIMLATTARGDAYTMPEYEEMFRTSGFTQNELHQAPAGPHQVIVSRK